MYRVIEISPTPIPYHFGAHYSIRFSFSLVSDRMDCHQPENAHHSITVPLLVGDGDTVSTITEHQPPPLKLETKAGEGHDINASVTAGYTSFYKTCFNGLNALSGVGMLSVPYALSTGGWFSLILLLVIACSACYTGLLIQRCMDMDSNIKTYPDIGERAFGTKGRALVSILMNTELYMVATGFLILEGDNLHNLFPGMTFEIGGFTVEGREAFVLIVSLIILPTVWMKNMSILSIISAGGVVASVVLLCSIFWTGAVDGIGFHEKGTFWNWNGIPTAVSLYSFCYCAHPVFPTLYTSMRNRRQFSKVMVVCFFLCTVTYALMAVLGYLMFGSKLMSQITLNLPINKISSKVAVYTTLVNPIAKYALMVTPIVNAVENRLLPNCNKRSFSLFIRTSLVLSTVFVALAVPFFGSLMSLVGAFLSVTASIIVPCLCFLKISGIYRVFGFEQLIIEGIVLFGFLIMMAGSYVSVMEIVQEFSFFGFENYG